LYGVEVKLPPLTSGRIIRRYKRFLADVELSDGTMVTAHCPNTGTMKSCWEPGAAVELSYSDNPRRKLQWTLERVDMGQGWVGVNTMRTNGVVTEAVEQGRVPQLLDYRLLKREVSFQGESGLKARFDIQLREGKRPDAFVEVKNVTLLDGDRVRFPDAVTERGRKHLELLLEVVGRGMRGIVLFAVNRPEGDCFSSAETIDPAYARRLREVISGGVEALAVRIAHTKDGLQVKGPVPMDLDP
jgi:sugar fermentation stimulation protein A